MSSDPDIDAYENIKAAAVILMIITSTIAAFIVAVPLGFLVMALWAGFVASAADDCIEENNKKVQ